MIFNVILSCYVSLFFTVCVLYTQGMGNKEWREVRTEKRESVYHRICSGHFMLRHQSSSTVCPFSEAVHRVKCYYPHAIMLTMPTLTC